MTPSGVWPHSTRVLPPCCFGGAAGGKEGGGDEHEPESYCVLGQKDGKD